MNALNFSQNCAHFLDIFKFLRVIGRRERGIQLIGPRPVTGFENYTRRPAPDNIIFIKIVLFRIKSYKLITN